MDQHPFYFNYNNAYAREIADPLSLNYLRLQDQQELAHNLPEQQQQKQDRSCSAPPKFDSQSLFMYQEDDYFTRNFTKGFMPIRMEENYKSYVQFQNQNQRKNDQRLMQDMNHSSTKASQNQDHNSQTDMFKSDMTYQQNPMPSPITAADEDELLNQLKEAGFRNVALGAGLQTRHQPKETSIIQNVLIDKRSSESGHSTSPEVKLGKKTLDLPQNLIRRRHRLSTISSDMNDDINIYDQDVRVSMKQRRKSSNFDMLSDPFKYQDYVNKFLDGIDEEEESKHTVQGRKRTRSSNFLTRAPYLHEIDEEDHELYNEQNQRQINNMRVKEPPTQYIKQQMQSYQLNNKTNDLGQPKDEQFQQIQLQKEYSINSSNSFSNTHQPNTQLNQSQQQIVQMGLAVSQAVMQNMNPLYSQSSISQHHESNQANSQQQQDLIQQQPSLKQQQQQTSSRQHRQMGKQPSQNQDHYSPQKQNQSSHRNVLISNQAAPQQQQSQQQQQAQPKSYQVSPSKTDQMTVSQIAKKFNLVSTFETLEGHEHLQDNEIKQLLEYSAILARDQGGCRFLQKKIEDNNEEYTNKIFINTIDNFMELMNDPFGNYLAQKLTETVREEFLTEIIHKVKEDPVGLCRNSHGTRSIQKIIEVVKQSKQIELLANYLKEKVQELAEDINGNHVIQKILFTWDSTHNQFIYEAMMSKCVEIACHKHGCCVMQKCIDGANKQQKLELTLKIADHTQVFVRNPYGNYVVQYVLELKMLEVNKRIGEMLLGSLLKLGMEKFSSNVIEKCLEHNCSEVKEAMVKEILQADSFYDFLLDQYGNYVIQKSLSVAVDPYFTQFIEKLRPDIERLRYSNDFGLKIYNRLLKQYPQLYPESKASKGGPYPGPGKKKDQIKGGKNNQGSGQKKKKPQGSGIGGGPQGIGKDKLTKSQSQQYSKGGYPKMGYEGVYYGGMNSMPPKQQNSNVNINTNINTNFNPQQHKDNGVYFSYKPYNYYQN